MAALMAGLCCVLPWLGPFNFAGMRQMCRGQRHASDQSQRKSAVDDWDFVEDGGDDWDDDNMDEDWDDDFLYDDDDDDDEYNDWLTGDDDVDVVLGLIDPEDWMGTGD